jgi:hypothetical protein
MPNEWPLFARTDRPESTEAVISDRCADIAAERRADATAKRAAIFERIAVS